MAELGGLQGVAASRQIREIPVILRRRHRKLADARIPEPLTYSAGAASAVSARIGSEASEASELRLMTASKTATAA